MAEPQRAAAAGPCTPAPLPAAVKVLISAEELEQREDLSLPPQVMRELQEEAAVMARIRHPNIGNGGPSVGQAAGSFALRRPRQSLACSFTPQ